MLRVIFLLQHKLIIRPGPRTPKLSEQEFVGGEDQCAFLQAHCNLWWLCWASGWCVGLITPAHGPSLTLLITPRYFWHSVTSINCPVVWTRYTSVPSILVRGFAGLLVWYFSFRFLLPWGISLEVSHLPSCRIPKSRCQMFCLNTSTASVYRKLRQFSGSCFCLGFSKLRPCVTPLFRFRLAHFEVSFLVFTSASSIYANRSEICNSFPSVECWSSALVLANAQLFCHTKYI